MSKKTLDLRSMQIDCQYALSPCRDHQIRHKLRGNGYARTIFLIERPYPKYGTTAVTLSADDRRKASSITSNSIKFGSVGGTSAER